MAITSSRALTGAWIETALITIRLQHTRSRPHGRVDRNALAPPATSISTRVAPSRARGSKPMASGVGRPAPGRALTGAWIETRKADEVDKLGVVAPSRARGSKQPRRPTRPEIRKSRPHGRVDRNLHPVRLPNGCHGRALTGAWIETRKVGAKTRATWSRPHGRVDRNGQHRVGGRPAPTSRPHGRVDRNAPCGGL